MCKNIKTFLGNYEKVDANISSDEKYTEKPMFRKIIVQKKKKK